MKGLRFFFYHIKRNPLSIIGLVLIIIFAIIAIFAPLIAPTPEGQFDSYMIPRDGWASTPEPPSADHIFGTTQGQYDIFYGVIWGTRTAFLSWLRYL
jgi:peptide/nickel transport system permease protein